VTGTNEPLPFRYRYRYRRIVLFLLRSNTKKLRCNLLLCLQITIETYLDFIVLEKTELKHSAILYGFMLSFFRLIIASGKDNVNLDLVLGRGIFLNNF